MKSVNYFVHKKPSPQDQKILNQLDELIPQMGFEELLVAAYQILDNIACCVEDTELSREVVDLATSLDEDAPDTSSDTAQVAVLRYIMQNLCPKSR